MLLSEEWTALLEGATSVPVDADLAGHDPVVLCRSVVGHLARHFLYLRALARRVDAKVAGAKRSPTLSPKAVPGGGIPPPQSGA